MSSNRHDTAKCNLRLCSIVAPIVEDGIKTKVCKECGANKPIKEFGVNGKTFDNRRATCKACESIYNKKRGMERRKRNNEFSDMLPI